MYVLIQSNLYKDPDFDRIYPVLEELNIPYEKIQLTSSMNEVGVTPKRDDVFVYGSVKLAMLAKQNTSWYPGSFYGGNHLFEENSFFFKDHLLNYPIDIKRLSEKFDWIQNEVKFIKPYKFAKLFTGKVFTRNEWEDFAEDTLKNPHTPLISENSLIQISAPVDIIKEARLWIVGGKVVESVYYKILKDIPFEEQVSQEGIDFANRMIALLNVAEAFVMDICLTETEWKIVEVNCINSAGFFPNVNIGNIFRALRDHFSQ